VTCLLLLVVAFTLIGGDSKDESKERVEDIENRPTGIRNPESSACRNYEYFTNKGCVECITQIENCMTCYFFEATADNSPLYNSPVYESPESSVVKEYMACERCNDGFQLDFWRQ